MKQKAQLGKEVQTVDTGADEVHLQLQEQVAAARDQISKMTSHNEDLLEQVTS